MPTNTDQTTIAFVLDFPNEAAEELERLRSVQADLVAALQAYVDEANTHVMKGQPGSPFAVRLAAGKAALAKVAK